MIRPKYVLFMLVCLCISLGPLFAQNGVESVGSLVRNSDTIVIGVGSLQGTQAGASSRLTIAVKRVIKGDAAVGGTLTVTQSAQALTKCEQVQDAASVSAVWFLNVGADGNYQFAPSLGQEPCDLLDSRFEVGSGPVDPQWTYESSAQSEDKLAYELAASIASHGGDGPWAFVQNPFLLSGASSKALSDIYTKLQHSQVPHIHMAGLLGLVKLGDATALNLVESNLSQVGSMPLRKSVAARGQSFAITYGRNGDQHPDYSALFGRAISEISDPTNEVVSILGRMLLSSSSSLEYRRAAAHALQNVHSVRAVEELAPLLSDPDGELRAAAIGGLSCFANGAPAITSSNDGPNLMRSSPYKNQDTLSHFAMGEATIAQREDYYLTFWQQWWNQNATSIIAEAEGN